MNKLYRDEDNGKLMGVLQGVAEYLDKDPAIVRIVFSVLTLLTGVLPGILLYYILLICVPENPRIEQRQQGLRMLRVGR